MTIQDPLMTIYFSLEKKRTPDLYLYFVFYIVK